MTRRFGRLAVVCAAWAAACGFAAAQRPVGSLRGVVTDADFGTPLAGVEIHVVEAGRKVSTSDLGAYVVEGLPPGKYTAIASKEGYVRQVRASVVVAEGRLTDLDVALAGDFVDLEEVVVEDPAPIGGAGEVGLLNLRLETPAITDAIGADLIGRAGASDAASALRLVAGATVQDGKTAVIRGLPDRYVSSQINGVRLPSADEDKRAVELDQFPSTIIESLRVSKTFTPDQQGDASGGAVNLVLKGLPEEDFFFKVSTQLSANSQAFGEDRFLSYDGGGFEFFGGSASDRDMQLDLLGSSWSGAVGASAIDAPVDFKWSLAAGGRTDVGGGWSLGGFASLFYERDSAYDDKGRDDSYWVTSPGAAPTPETSNGDPQVGGQFDTSLFDVTRASRSVQWGVLGSVGIEDRRNRLGLTYLLSRTTEDSVTLAEDVRGKQFFHPGHDPDDPTSPGFGVNGTGDPDGSLLREAPYLRQETLEFTERATGSLQLSGHHEIRLGRWEVLDLFKVGDLEIDWRGSLSFADSDQPDKRQFGTRWLPRVPGYDFELFPGFVLPIPEQPAQHTGQPPGANINLGFLQRTWKTIEEESKQFSVDVKLPFEQWSGDEGYLKVGAFFDRVDRAFEQESFTNADTQVVDFAAYDDLWSLRWPSQSHPIIESTFDVDYAGEQAISAAYGMIDFPLCPELKFVGGARVESTRLSIVNAPEGDAFYYPPTTTPAITELTPGAADAAFERTDVLPSFAVEFRPFEELTLRASYNGTIARQTFKELTPIIQQDFLGGPIFIGNPNLRTATVDNYDFRVDYAPYEGGLVSASYFRKNVKDPIEYVQRVGDFTYTTAVNYPEGVLKGFEFEFRQDLGRWDDALEGLSFGANATFIDAEVLLPDDEIAQFALPNIQAPITSRDMTGAPDRLLNFFLTYDLPESGTQLALFYTVQGDSLVTGAGVDPPNFVPSIYARSYDTLNFSVTQRLAEGVALQFQAKNLTNPSIETVYRSPYIGSDVVNTRRSAGVEFAITLSATFTF